MARKTKKKKAIRTILIPNRGEIALRIVRSARSLGLRSVVACSEVDTDSLAVRLADDAVVLGSAPAAESYLSIERILDAARTSGADAIHPGYGFLSEREAFASAVEKAGLVFIGPTPENIALMGDKVRARSTLADAGVPIVPGDKHPIGSAEKLEALADRVGLPLLLKAAAGGGGKGIRLVREKDELESAFRVASSEAKNAFGDPTLFAERYLERARHVEVQVLGDGRGGARIYPERDCSIQRRHQKLIEESPCPAFNEKLREKLLGHALTALQVSKYRGAGTLEFLYDSSAAGDGRGDGLYFLEMNTRLQVEHPVTELVCGEDLVAGQIAVAEGKRFDGDTLDACRVAGRGAAVELRVNAEDPLRGFQPSTGLISTARLPGGPGIRVDSAAAPGVEITPYYDSLIAKIIAWGTDRDEALGRLRTACEETSIHGVATTLPVGLALFDDETFARGEHHCQYLESRLDDEGFLSPAPEQTLSTALAIAAALIHGGKVATAAVAAPAARRRDSSRVGDRHEAELSPWARLGRTHGIAGLSR